MKTKLFLLLIAVFLLGGLRPVYADSSDGISLELFKAAKSVILQIDQDTAIVDQQQVRIDVPPQLIDDRTMVPLRFIAEALGSEVAWDGQNQKITVLRDNKAVSLQIGHPWAKMNEREVRLDVPPQIVKDRTLVPLRFLAEALGAEVDWEAGTRRVVIGKPGRVNYVLAYYYGGAYAEFLVQAEKIDQVAFRWFDTNETGEIICQYPDSYQLALKIARDKKITTSASIFLNDSEQLHILLSSPENRQRLIDNAIKLVEKDGYQGINLDLELIRGEDKTGLNQLISDFRERLKTRNIELSMALPAKNLQTTWAEAYDYAVLGSLVDRVVIMAHDLHWKGGPAGAIAPLPWVESVIQYAHNQMPADKILLALGVYGYDWADTGKAKSYTVAQLNDMVKTNNTTAQWDSDAQSPFFTYSDTQNVNHIVWYEDDRSIRQKMNLPERYGIGGISIWKLGNGFPEMWQAIQRRIE